MIYSINLNAGKVVFRSLTTFDSMEEVKPVAQRVADILDKLVLILGESPTETEHCLVYPSRMRQ